MTEQIMQWLVLKFQMKEILTLNINDKATARYFEATNLDKWKGKDD